MEIFEHQRAKVLGHEPEKKPEVQHNTRKVKWSSILSYFSGTTNYKVF